MTRKLAALIAALVLSLTSGASALAIGSAGAPDAAQRAVPAAPATAVDRDQGPALFRAVPELGQQPLTLPTPPSRSARQARRQLNDSRQSAHRSPIRK